MGFFEDSMHELKENVGEYVPKVIASFANTDSGELIIGVKNDGRVTGVDKERVDEVQRKLENYIKAVVPTPNHSIATEIVEGKIIIKVRVNRFPEGFCTYKGVFYFRYGSSTERLEGMQLKDFLASHNFIYFDSQPCYEATIKDVDETKVRAFIEARSPGARLGAVADELKNLGLLRIVQGKHELSNAAVLFFGREPWMFFKQDEVRLVNFAGYDAAAPVLDKKDLRLTIPENVEESVRFIKKNTRTSYVIRGLERVDMPEYPDRVIREAIVNALAHRDYLSADAVQIRIFSNRIELVNPGLPPAGVDVSNIDSGVSIKRNPLIYQLMRDMHYMEGLASGIPMMKSEMKAAGMQPPEFSVIGSFLAVTLYNRLGKRFNFEMLSERQKRGIEAIRSNGRMTAHEYASLNGISAPTAIADLSSMVKEGLLKRIGKTRGSFYIINEI